jgi:trimeric autotransporter adhesin
MADSTISGLSAAAVADRAFEVPVNKGGGENAKVTLEQIVDLVSDTISNVLSVAQVPASVTSAELASVTSGVGGAGSVTSDELSAVSSQISLTNSALGSVNARATSLEVRLSTLSGIVSEEISARAASIQTLSDAVTSVNARVISILSNEISILESVVSVQLSQLISAVSNVSAQSAAGSATGLQNVINMLSNKISQVVGGSASVTSAEYLSLVDRVSANSGTGGGGLTSTQVSDMIGSVNGANYSTRAFSASGSAGTSVKGLQSVINQISNTFSNAFSAGSVLSGAVTSINNQISVMAGQTKVITATVVGSVGTALTDIDGTTVIVSAGGYYEYRAKLNVAISAANAYGIGITFPGQVDGGCTGIMQGIGSVGASAWESTIGNVRIMSFDDDGSGSVILSVVKGVVSVSPVHIDATFAVSTSGNIVLQYRASVSTSNVKINPGSHVRLFKLN